MSLIMPVVLALGALVSLPQQQPRDPRPPDLLRAAQAQHAKEQKALETAIAAAPDKLDLRFKLAKFQEEDGDYAAAEATLLAANEAFKSNPDVLTALAGLYNQMGVFEKTMGTLEEAERLEPRKRESAQRVAVFYWEKAFRDHRLTEAQKRTYIQAGIAATDRALAIDADYAEALTYKNIFLRIQAQMEADPAQRQQLIAQADELRARAMELSAGKDPSRVGPSRDAPPPPPPPPPPDGRYNGMAPVRVGGNVKAPTKIVDARPVYPPEAYASRVQGVVIIEATIDPNGFVNEARVLRSVPPLDQAAVDAVRQWQFTPTLLNGQPVPVIMTVTVNFTLQ